jgi:predicted nucleic acid-binding protein
MAKVIIDTSVAVKWFSTEEDTDKALKLRDRHVNNEIELAATPLLICEVVNALRYKPDFDSKKLIKAIGSLCKLHLHIEPITEDLLTKGAEIAFEGDVTIYDAIPVALADISRTTCITADEKTQYKNLKHKYPVKMLKEAGG